MPREGCNVRGGDERGVSGAVESLVEARPAEFGVGEDRTVEVRLAEVRLLVHFATIVCYFATF
jgi:hypothetical protein